MRVGEEVTEHTTHAFFVPPPSPCRTSRLVSAAQAEAENFGAAIWEHEGRETSTLITIHLRLMCAAGAGGSLIPSPHLSQTVVNDPVPLVYRSDNTQTQALVHDRFSLAKLLAWSWKSFAWEHRAH